MSNPIHRSLTTDHYLYLLKERDPFSPVAAQPIQVAFKDSYKKKVAFIHRDNICPKTHRSLSISGAAHMP
jgi:hypothetical protein